MGKKLLLICIGIVLLLNITTYFAVVPRVYACKKEDFVIVIDPGHGGIDPGVVGKDYGVKESDLNLDIAKALKRRFYTDGITVVLTRTADNGLYGNVSEGFKLRDLKNRIKVAEDVGADLYISIHINEYSDRNRRGAQVFYKAGSDESKTMANCIQSALNKMDESKREYSSLSGDYYVLNNSTCPAVIVECGFLSNSEEEKLLMTNTYREKIAHTIYYGVTNYLYNIEK